MAGLLQELHDQRQSPLEAGIDSYFTARDRAENLKLQKKQQKLGLLQAGYQETPEGEFSRTAESQAELDRKRASDERSGLLQEAELGAKGYSTQRGPDGKSSILKTPEQTEKEALERRRLKAQALKDEADARKAGMGPNAGQGDAAYKGLPKEGQIQVESLAKDIGTKKAIMNNMRSAAAMLRDDSISEEQKLVQARSLIKLLNSAQGQDAVSVDEAKRLAALIEYNVMPNLTNPGPVFGRAPITDFADQVEQKAIELEGAAGGSQKQIDELYGRPSQSAAPARAPTQAPSANAVTGKPARFSTEGQKEMEINGERYINTGTGFRKAPAQRSGGTGSF